MKYSIVLAAPKLPEQILSIQHLCDWLPYTVNPLYRIGAYGDGTTHATFSNFIQDLSYWLQANMQNIQDMQPCDAAFLESIQSFLTKSRIYAAANGIAYIQYIG
jgi:hypothetical protein